MSLKHYCEAPECAELAVRGAWCDSHSKQLERGQPLRPIRPGYASTWEMVCEAWLSYADATEDDEFARARARCRNAMDSHYEALGWLSPKRVAQLRRKVTRAAANDNEQILFDLAIWGG